MRELDKCRQVKDPESGRILLYRDEVEVVLTAGDCISRKDAIDTVSKACGEWRGIFADCEEGLKALPSAQPDIIACGDCKHWICHDRRCGYWNHGVKPLDWCCHGEKNGGLTDG